jgi:hypothetical protein
MAIITVEGKTEWPEQEHIKMNNLDETLEKVKLFFTLAENEANKEKPDMDFVDQHIRWAKDQLYIYISEITKRARTSATFPYDIKKEK